MDMLKDLNVPSADLHHLTVYHSSGHVQHFTDRCANSLRGKRKKKKHIIMYL